MKPYERIYREWRENPLFDEDFRRELASIEGDEREIEDRFYRDLEFGTAGMRGVIGAGRNRINRYNVRRATQGFADFLTERAASIGSERVSVVAYDSRRCSREFAEETARVLAANRFTVYLFDEVRTTPQLSYAVRWLRAAGGVMITASHNPPEYNGYKVYDENGCQLVPHLADRLSELVSAVESFDRCLCCDYEQALSEGRIRKAPVALDDDYAAMVRSTELRPLLPASDIRVVYTPLHGTGGAAIRRVLEESGFRHLIPVTEQMEPDGEFPTIRTPNPESGEAFDAARRYLEKHRADLAIATDPDCDRLGLMTGRGTLLTGNQIGCLFLEYILSTRRQQGRLRSGDYVVSTIVSTNLASRIAAEYGVRCVQTLTGFKYIGEQIERDPSHFIMGFEESYGYLFSPEVRDKDAVMATRMAIEMATFYGGDLEAALDRIYDKYGCTIEDMISKTYAGKDGSEQMRRIMENARSADAGFAYAERTDYRDDETGLPPADVIRFAIDENAWMVLRPSGTEPKLKVYLSVSAENRESAANGLERLREIALRMIDPNGIRG